MNKQRPGARKVFRIAFSLLCLALLTSGLSRVKLEKTAGPRTVRVLCYHDITPTPLSKYSRTPEQLRRDFQVLRDHGFEVIGLEEAIKAGQKKNPLTGRFVVLTFDDATRGQYRYARPLLKRFGYPASFFVPTAMVESGRPVSRGQTGVMTWPDLRTLVREGFQIASHGHTHRDLSRLSASRLRGEVQKSFALLKKRLNVETADLCLPFGLYRRDQENLFAGMGVRSIALTTTDHGPGNPALVKIRRFEVLKDTGTREILNILGAGREEKEF